jgi:hypothetical protein
MKKIFPTAFSSVISACSLTLTILLFSSVMLLAPQCNAGIIYQYVGKSFETVTGPPLTTLDRVSGLVEFATNPLPLESGKSDVIAYLFSAGLAQISDATAGQVPPIFSFDFDALGRISNWQVIVATNGPGSPMVEIASIHIEKLGSWDDHIWNVAFGVNATESGVWTVVSEPPSVFVWLAALPGIVLMWRQRHVSSTLAGVAPA